MAISASNIQQNHRAVYFEFTGDGASTSIAVTYPGRPRAKTAVATVITAPTSTSDKPSGKGGLSYPTGGTNVAVSSCTLSGATATVVTSAAVTNGVKAYGIVVFNEYTD